MSNWLWNSGNSHWMNLSWSWKLNDHFCMALGQDKQRATTFQQLHNLQELSQCLYRTTLYIYSLPVYGFKSSSSLRANSGIFNIDSATAISLYIPPLSDIAYWVGFSSLTLGKFYCFLHPFHELMHAKHCYCLSHLSLGSSFNFYFCCCHFRLPLQGLLILFTSSSSFSPPFQLCDRWQVGLWWLLSSVLQTQSILRVTCPTGNRFSSCNLFSLQTALWNLLP